MEPSNHFSIPQLSDEQLLALEKEAESCEFEEVVHMCRDRRQAREQRQ